MNVPIHAKVECTDGVGGETVAVIVNPVESMVTHFVVATDTWPREQVLVSVEQVVETTRDLVRLGCTQEELSQMDPFVETHYIPGESDWQDETADYVVPHSRIQSATDVPIEVWQIPEGSVAVHRGAKVAATDGDVGTVSELLLHPESGEVTHIVMTGGLLWERREVTIPVSAVERVGVHDDVVFLNIDKETVGKLPAIPAERSYRQVELIAQVFDTPEGAGEALKFMQDLRRFKVLRIRGAAVVVKDAEGKVEIQETADLDVKGGRLFGAITGGLVGLLGGPVGAVIGALAGAGVGGAAAKAIDVGLPDEFLEEVQEHLQPGSSAMVLLVQAHWARTVSEELAELNGVILNQGIADAVVERLSEEQGG